MATQNDIRADLISTVEAVSTVHKVGSFPDDVPRIGNNYPSVMIGDGSEVWESSSGDREIISYTIPIYLYHNVTNSRLTTMNNITVEVIKAILADLTLGGTCINVVIDSVDKGDYSEELNMYLEGYYPKLTIRKINFIITYFDNRSC